MDLQQAIRRIVTQHGGVRKAARALEVDPGYLSELLNGNKDNPSDDTLDKLGLICERTYDWK
jgi:transcriptional regulator with XRE-family HTH domain